MLRLYQEFVVNASHVMHRMRDWVIDDGVYEPNPQSLIRLHHFRQQKHLHRPDFTDQTRQSLRTAQSGQYAQAGAAMSKDSIRRGDAIAQTRARSMPAPIQYPRIAAITGTGNRSTANVKA